MGKDSSFLDVTSFSIKEFNGLAKATDEERMAKISSLTKKSYTKEDILKISPMTFVEEFTAVMLFLFGVPGAVFSIPVVLILIGMAIGRVWQTVIVGVLLLLPLSILPAPISDKALSSWYALQILRYFSFKAVYEERIQKDKPYILVAPPHGVFPFGNIVTMIAFPSVMGFSFDGLAASAAVRMPIFRQLLCSVGGIDASKKVAVKHLNRNRTIGISTGGVAEVFETNSASGDEVIVLKNRKGIIKLAFQTGASLVPCYLFGNTHLLSLWTGGSFHNFFKKLSRKIGENIDECLCCSLSYVT